MKVTPATRPPYNEIMKGAIAVLLAVALPAIAATGQKMDARVAGLRFDQETFPRVFDAKQKLYLFSGGD
jgi:hypothetical protein